MRPVDDNRSSSSTLSAAPSLSNSKISLGATSHCSQKSTCSQKSHVSAERPLTREEVIAQYLEKAKWYTSVCLGKFPRAGVEKKFKTIFFHQQERPQFFQSLLFFSWFRSSSIQQLAPSPRISIQVKSLKFSPNRWAFTVNSAEPVTCVVSDHTYSEGIKNCTWSSCREGKFNKQTCRSSWKLNSNHFRLHNRTNQMSSINCKLHKSPLQGLD